MKLDVDCLTAIESGRDKFHAFLICSLLAKSCTVIAVWINLSSIGREIGRSCPYRLRSRLLLCTNRNSSWVIRELRVLEWKFLNISKAVHHQIHQTNSKVVNSKLIKIAHNFFKFVTNFVAAALMIKLWSGENLVSFMNLFLRQSPPSRLNGDAKESRQLWDFWMFYFSVDLFSRQIRVKSLKIDQR